MGRDSAILPLYRGATTLFTPFAPHLLQRRLHRGKEDAARLRERMGVPGARRPDGFLAWLHGASLGEGLALLPIIERLRARDVAILLTTGTTTSARVLASRLPEGAVHQFMPLDLPRYLHRFLEHWRPDIVLLAESELWPNAIVEVSRRAIPLALVNARMSARSHARWRRAPSLIGAMLSRASLCLAQSPGDAARYADLGASGVSVAGNLKYDAMPPPAKAESLAELTRQVAGRPVWLAASTHADEEPLILKAHRDASARLPGLLTLIVPRQAERGGPLVQQAEAQGLASRRRSAGETPDAQTALYVADTFGELGLFYRAANLVFVGKSLAGGGGQNPIEPAKLRRGVLHGPLVSNFEDVYRSLDEAGGALPVQDGPALTEALIALLSDRGRLEALATAASATVDRQGGAADKIIASLAPWLPGLPARVS